MPVGQLVAAVRGGASVLVTGSAGTAPLLAALAQLLARTGSRIRVLHVRPPLDLLGFMRQVARADGALDGSALEQGFEALTIPDAGCDRIALLVEDADKMPQKTLRYLELALGAAPCLQVILAGRSGIADMLALEGFAGLRRRIALHISLPDAKLPPVARPSHALMAGVTLPVQPVPAGLPRPRRTPPLRLAGFALAASLALVAGALQFRPSPGGGAALARLAPPASVVPAGPPSEQAASAAAADGPSAGADQASGVLAAARPAPVVEPRLASVSEPAAAEAPEPAAPEPQASERPTPGTAMPEPAMESASAAPDHQPDPPSEPDPAVLLAGPPPGPAPALPAEAPPPEPSAAEPALAAAGLPPSAPAAAGEAVSLEPDPVPLPRLPLLERPPAAPALAAILPVPPAPHRAQSRPAPIHPERVTDRPAAPAPDAQRCRSIILRLQLGETPNDGERTYLRNGCR